MNITTCRSCGARIFWAVSINGKPTPMDAEPVGKASVLKVNPNDPVTPVFKVVDAFQTHFVSCPNSAAHRKTNAAEQDSTEKDPTNA